MGLELWDHTKESALQIEDGAGAESSHKSNQGGQHMTMAQKKPLWNIYVKSAVSSKKIKHCGDGEYVNKSARSGVL